MKTIAKTLALALFLFLTRQNFLTGQEHAEHADSKKSGTSAVEAPKLFLDKSPKVVEYQLKRLSNAQLLGVQVVANDAKFAPVLSAIASRAGMSSEQRESAINSLAKIKGTSFVATVFEPLRGLNNSDRSQQQIAADLTKLVMSASREGADLGALRSAATDESAYVARAAFAGLIEGNNSGEASEIAKSNNASRTNLLAAMKLVPEESSLAILQDFVTESLEAKFPVAVRRAAVAALPKLSDASEDKFAKLAELVREPELEEVSVQSFLTLDLSTIASSLAESIAQHLVARAEATTASERTSNRFVDFSQLVERLMARVPETESRRLRSRMQAIAVRVIRIKTVPEEMRYDLKYFVAATGKPIQLLLQNDDLMPHNLVIVQPGTLKEVALLASAMAPEALTDGKQYVPAVKQVLFATNMVQAGKQERLTFTAPTTAGEYPFVCTYPNHWMRMYGVMVVVDDVDSFMQQPIEPKDPIGNNRSFVKSWKVTDFEGKLESGLRGRSQAIGAKLFVDATCLQCHVIEGKGGRVGPELDGVFKRHQDDSLAVLREIIDPSHKIDPKYASHSILTRDGQVYSGVIVAESEKSISLINNPDQIKPTVVERSEIEDMVQSPKSIMPAALLDQFTQDEIFELLAYVKEANAKVSQ